MGQRLTGMTAYQSSLPTAPSAFKFARHGHSGASLSELLPHTAKIVDEISFIKSMHTEQINHDPAITFSLTGFQLAGRPSLGSWIAYGLGSENRDLPAFVVMVSIGRTGGDQPLYDRLWGSGFLPSRYQGVKFHNGADPVLYLSNPPGIDKEVRRRFLDDLAKLNQINAEEFGDPEILSRVAQYEMAYRMQSSVPELTDLSKEPEKTFERYGPDARKPGTFASNCILARRLAERGVRFIQLFHRGWDQHGDLPEEHRETGAGHRSAYRRADYGFERSRDARRHAGRLGRRIRPHRLFARQADRRPITAATIIRAVLRSGSPAEESNPASRSARRTISATTSRAIRSTSTT